MKASKMLNLFSFQQQVFSADLRRTRLKIYLVSEKKNESHPTSKIVDLTRPPSDLAPYVYSFNDPFLLYFLHKAQMFSPGHACYPRKDETFLLCVTVITRSTLSKRDSIFPYKKDVFAYLVFLLFIGGLM
jgi:hypothetical protein